MHGGADEIIVRVSHLACNRTSLLRTCMHMMESFGCMLQRGID